MNHDTPDNRAERSRRSVVHLAPDVAGTRDMLLGPIEVRIYFKSRTIASDQLVQMMRHYFRHSRQTLNLEAL